MGIKRKRNLIKRRKRNNLIKRKRKNNLIKRTRKKNLIKRKRKKNNLIKRTKRRKKNHAKTIHLSALKAKIRKPADGSERKTPEKSDSVVKSSSPDPALKLAVPAPRTLKCDKIVPRRRTHRNGILYDDPW